MKKSRQLSSVKTKKDERKVMGRALKGVAMPAAEVLVRTPGGYAAFLRQSKNASHENASKQFLQQMQLWC